MSTKHALDHTKHNPHFLKDLYIHCSIHLHISFDHSTNHQFTTSRNISPRPVTTSNFATRQRKRGILGNALVSSKIAERLARTRGEENANLSTSRLSTTARGCLAPIHVDHFDKCHRLESLLPSTNSIIYIYMGVYFFTVVGPGSLNRWYIFEGMIRGMIRGYDSRV